MMAAFIQDITNFTPELLLLVGVLAMLVVGAFVQESYETVMRLSFVVLAGTLALLFISPTAGDPSFGAFFIQTAGTRFAKVIVMLAAIATLALSHHALGRAKAQKFEFPILIILSVLGMCLMISSRDMLALYVGIELQSLALYILASFVRNDSGNAEAGLKYFVLGALSSGLFLYGLSLLYGATGSLQYETIARFVSSGPVGLPVTLALVFILAAMAFKISAAPFHMWTPDVYQGAMTPITAFFSAAPKVAGALVMVQFLHVAVPGASVVWVQIIWAAAALSLLVGSLGALMQQNLKRLLAYSTINHVGFLLIAILCGGEDGFTALFIYLTVYVTMSLGVFAAILFLQQQGAAAETLTDFQGLSCRHPRSALAIAILMFAMAGVPPTAGFLGKMVVLLAAMQAGYVWLAALGVITSVIAAFYYLRVIKIMYFDEPVESIIVPRVAFSRRIALVLTVTTAITACLMLSPSLLVDPASTAAQSLGFTGGR